MPQAEAMHSKKNAMANKLIAIHAMTIQTQANHRKYVEVQTTARTLHGQLQTARCELAEARRASRGSTSGIDARTLTSAIKMAVAAAVARPARPAALITNPYEGDIDLTTKSGNTLFDDGSQALTVTFDGRPEKLHPFLSALKNRSPHLIKKRRVQLPTPLLSDPGWFPQTGPIFSRVTSSSRVTFSDFLLRSQRQTQRPFRFSTENLIQQRPIQICQQNTMANPCLLSSS